MYVILFVQYSLKLCLYAYIQGDSQTYVMLFIIPSQKTDCQS
jgi:hypothetical protein